MDYEKAYKAALTTAKQWIKDGSEPSTKKCLELLFPELAESEDERIIRDIHDLLVNACEADRRYPELLAWLEKQKEQVMDETDKIAAAYQLGRSDERKQKEQKPVEKQDYSGLNDLERAIHRGFLVAGVENVPVGIIKETVQDCLAHLPAKWSDYKDKIDVPYCSSEPEWSEEESK